MAIMIARKNSFLWFSLQFSVAVAGAASSEISSAVGLACGLLTLPLFMFTLLQGWRVRENPQDNKNLSDLIAVAGLLLFLGLIFTTTLNIALGALLLVATLALNTQLTNYRKFYLVQLISFVFLLAGAAEAKHGSYLIIMMLYCVFASFALTEAWLDRGEQNMPVKGPGFRQRFTLAGSTLMLAFIIYLVTPRLEPLNFGAQPSSAADFYHNQSWQNQARSSDNQPEQQELKPGDQDNEQQFRYQDLKEITDLSDFNLTASNSEGYEYKGFNENFDIRATNRSGQVDLQAIVARMQAPHGSYLKVRSFDHFDGVSWKSIDENIHRKLEATTTGEIRLNNDLQGDFQHTLFIDQLMPAWLPTAPNPVALWVPSSTVALDQFGQPLLPAPLQPGTRYTVQSKRDFIGQHPTAMGIAPRKRDLQLPRKFDRRIRNLARQVVRGVYDPLGKAQEIGRASCRERVCMFV